MAAQTNSSSSGFHRELNGLAINFQSGAINCSASEMIPVGLGSGNNSSYLSGLIGSSSNSGTIQQGTHSGSSVGTKPEPLLIDYVPGLKHDAGLAVEWTAEEQYALEQGLERYSAEPTIMKYIRIAATLRDKTVRDVAFRCKWWGLRKRRKAEEHNAGKLNNRKDKLVQTSSSVPISMAAWMMQPMGQNEHMAFNGLSGPAKNLLEQNAQDFGQIKTNLSTFKLQENIDLFCRTRNNITAILNDMNETTSFMSQMPPLPVSVDDDLMRSLLPNDAQGFY